MNLRTTLSPTLSTTLIPTQVNISAPLTPPIPTMFWPTMRPTLRMTLRPSLSSPKCFTPTPLLQLAADDAKFGDQVGRSVSLFGGWSIVDAPNSNNTKGRAYLYKRFLGPRIIVKKFRQAMGMTVIFLVEVFLLMKKSWLSE